MLNVYVCFRVKMAEHFICDATYSHKIWNALCRRKKNITNYERCSSTDQAIGLLPKSHQFESRKSHSHWRLTWSLTSGPVGLVKTRANWLRHPR